jgi:hypothetical protein
MPSAKVIKTCTCGKTFTKAEWQQLRLTTKHGGRVEYADGHLYEFRHCSSCLSTLALTVTHQTPAPLPAVRPSRAPSQPSLDVAASAMLRVSSRDK